MRLALCSAIMHEDRQAQGRVEPQSKNAKDSIEGIARVLGMQSEVSYRLRELLDSASLNAEDARAIPNLQLFYNLEEIFSQIVHEGRNHLSPVLGYASLIREATAEGASERKWAGRIARGVESMDRYFDGLELYRMKGISQVHEVGWSSFLDETLESFSVYNKNNVPIHIINRVRGEVWLHTELIKRLVLHVMRNAYESLGDGGAITVSAELRPERHVTGTRQRIELLITDNGCGIANSKMRTIWTPFFTTKASHFGLGLPYVSMAAAVLGIQIDVKSRMGAGTRFSCLLEHKGGDLEPAKDPHS